MSKLGKLTQNPLAFLLEARPIGSFRRRIQSRSSTLSRFLGRRVADDRPLSSLFNLGEALAESHHIPTDVRFVHVPTFEESSDSIVRHIDCPEVRVALLSLWDSITSPQQQEALSHAVLREPDLFRRLCLRVLFHLKQTIRGVVLTDDCSPLMRQFVFACREARLPTILVTYDGFVTNPSRFYVNPVTGVDIPACDHACVPGRQQADLFEARGYPKSRITLTGAPTLDRCQQFVPELTHEQFCGLYGFDPTRAIALVALDASDDTSATLEPRLAERRTLEDISGFCWQNRIQLLIWSPPHPSQSLARALEPLARLPHVALDRARPHLTRPEEAIHHATVVCSAGNALLLEAALLRRPAISLQYSDCPSAWEQLAGSIARDRVSLCRSLERALSATPPLVDVGPDSPLARACSPASFDGRARARVRHILARYLEASPATDGVDQFDYLFSERVLDHPPQGTIGYHRTPTSVVRYVPAMLGCRSLRKPADLADASNLDALAYWGAVDSAETPLSASKARLDNFAHRLGIPRFVLEDGLIRSVDIGLSGTPTLSLLIDRKAPYYDATQPTALEDHLNADWSLNDQQLARVRRCIALIAERRVSKYNHAPDAPVPFPKRSVLVLDQRFGDVSVTRGLANETHFLKMLVAAHDENPDSLILVKRHPDAMSGGKRAYFSDATMAGFAHLSRLRLVDFEVNPHALFDVCSKVYVVTSGMGFEALLRGLEVHCFGMPFYAGWGITHDRQVCSRRHRTRTLDELFFGAFLIHSRYYHPTEDRVCELEELIDFIGATRAPN